MLSESERIEAIAREARRRRTSYGALVPQLSREETDKIYEEYERKKRRKAVGLERQTK